MNERWIRCLRSPQEWIAWAVFLGATFLVVVYPFLQTPHPPITDLPFHAAHTSIFRHYLDSSWGFRDQFELFPFQVPYLTSYLLGAALALVFPITWAVKLSSIVMLLFLPAGLGTLRWGMGRNPIGGGLALVLVWSQLTHWGFLNYVGALGVYAACLGVALHTLGHPSLGSQITLFSLLTLLFFTHIYRLPFALLGIAGACLVMYPGGGRPRSILLPWLGGCGLLGLWLLLRGPTLAPEIRLELAWERLTEIRTHFYDSFVGAAARDEERAIAWSLAILGGLGGAAAIISWLPGKSRAGSQQRWLRWSVLLVFILCAGHLLAYLLLPMRLGEWWMVYPREAIAAGFIALALVPDLPPGRWSTLLYSSVIAISTLPMGSHVATQWRRFHKINADFRHILEEVPPRSRILYLIYDHRGAQKRHSAFVHMPAWIQAEKGGSLSFHFAGWKLFPVQYRAEGEHPPPVHRDWEWRPQDFRAHVHAPYFDTFLVRHQLDPLPMLRSIPNLRLVKHEGTWWLFTRVRP